MPPPLDDMKKVVWRKHHKWLGIVLSLFLLMFCASGIVLNHREAVSGAEVSRRWLPSRYEFKDWNGGLLRGTILYIIGGDSASCVLLYGAGGIWRTDSAASGFADFNNGLPAGADNRQVKAVVQAAGGSLFAVTQSGLYRHCGREGAGWRKVPLGTNGEEALSDITCHEDTLVVVGRSYLYLSVPPYDAFRRIGVKAPDGYEPEVTLFRTVWMLHTGELFGKGGKLVMDGVAVVLAVLCVTGLLCWLLPKYVRHGRHVGHPVRNAANMMRSIFGWHDRIGRTTIVLTLLIAVTGWCLRPPAMILLALNKTKPIPGTALDSRNPWHDKLRMVRHDDACGDWLLSTSGGFYSLASLDGIPEKVEGAPPVSVMGLNVWQRDAQGNWLCGSFSGLFAWDRPAGTVIDCFTRKPAPEQAGPPFGAHAVSGYSGDFGCKAFPVEYYDGTDAVTQPESLATLPMPLWNLALEVHSGRIYIGSIATYVFIFIIGAGIVWCLVAGWKIGKGGF